MSDLVLGVNLPRTIYGKELNDGAACFANRSGILGAVAEERLRRTKRIGGYTKAVEALNSSLSLNIKDLQLIVLSSCCEVERTTDALPEFPEVPTVSCNHHLSHALSVFCPSPFRQALVLVLDGGGNILTKDDKEWWNTQREQQSYYVASDSDVSIVGQDFTLPRDAGLGEIYRAATYYLGWRSSRFAGKLMALAAMGNPSAFEGKRAFYLDTEGTMRSLVENNPNAPIEMIEELLTQAGLSGIGARDPESEFETFHRDFAAWIQRELERVLVEKIDFLVARTGIRDVCIAGGVAYNCKALQAVRENCRIDRMYVGPVSGDHGQSLGNALYGLNRLHGGKLPRVRLSPYLGPKRSVALNSRGDLQGNGKEFDLHSPTSADVVARLIASAKVVGWVQGRSEFGPRALGNRSIVASPSLASLIGRLNRIKGREAFMPFAPAVLAEHANEYFEISEEIPFMTMCVRVRPEWERLLSGVTSSDGTARIQTVTKKDNPRFYSLIEEYSKLTSIPILLNTSLNGKDEPIVESARDALSAFHHLGLDALVVGETLLRRKTLRDDVIPSVSVLGKEISDATVEEIVDLLARSQDNFFLSPRDKILLFNGFYEWLETGRKTTTVRYRSNMVDFPISSELPLFVTEDFSVAHAAKPVTKVRIVQFVVKRYCELTKEDAARDGFNTLKALKRTLWRIYGPINSKELVSIYTLQDGANN